MTKSVGDRTPSPSLGQDHLRRVKRPNSSASVYLLMIPYI
jgi:hypothetical protein